MIFSSVLLDAMVYSGAVNENAAEVIKVEEMQEAVAGNLIQRAFGGFVGFLCIMAVLWIYLIIFSWIFENKHMIPIRNISFFKLLTFGKLEASEVSAKQLILLFLFGHLVIFMVAFGIVQTFIQWVVLKMVDVFDVIQSLIMRFLS